MFHDRSRLGLGGYLTRLTTVLSQPLYCTVITRDQSDSPTHTRATSTCTLHYRLPFVPLRTPHFTGIGNPELFLNDLERHYHLNSTFFAGEDSPRRVEEARTAMSGASAVWFDNLTAAHPDVLTSYRLSRPPFTTRMSEAPRHPV